MAVHTGDKVKGLPAGRKSIQGQHRHLRPEVGATDADVDDVRQLRIGAHRLGIGQHRIERSLHLSMLGRYIFDST